MSRYNWSENKKHRRITKVANYYRFVDEITGFRWALTNIPNFSSAKKWGFPESNPVDKHISSADQTEGRTRDMVCGLLNNLHRFILSRVGTVADPGSTVLVILSNFSP